MVTNMPSSSSDTGAGTGITSVPLRPTLAPGLHKVMCPATCLLTTKAGSTLATWQQSQLLHASGARSKAPPMEKARPAKPPALPERIATTKAAFLWERQLEQLKKVPLQQALEDSQVSL